MAKRWYVLHVYSGFENKVAEDIKSKAAKQGMAEKVEEIMVPTEEVVEMRQGQRRKSERKFFPGYVLVKMELTDEGRDLVRTMQPFARSITQSTYGKLNPAERLALDFLLRKMLESGEEA